MKWKINFLILSFFALVALALPSNVEAAIIRTYTDLDVGGTIVPNRYSHQTFDYALGNWSLNGLISVGTCPLPSLASTGYWPWSSFAYVDMSFEVDGVYGYGMYYSAPVARDPSVIAQGYYSNSGTYTYPGPTNVGPLPALNNLSGAASLKGHTIKLVAIYSIYNQSTGAYCTYTEKFSDSVTVTNQYPVPTVSLDSLRRNNASGSTYESSNFSPFIVGPGGFPISPTDYIQAYASGANITSNTSYSCYFSYSRPSAGWTNYPKTCWPTGSYAYWNNTVNIKNSFDPSGNQLYFCAYNPVGQGQCSNPKEFKFVENGVCGSGASPTIYTSWSGVPESTRCSGGYNPSGALYGNPAPNTHYYWPCNGLGEGATNTWCTAQIQYCGNGRVESYPTAEQCDDGSGSYYNGNGVNGDGCSTTCQYEPPTANITANGLESITVNVGDYITYSWSSLLINSTSWSSAYTSNCGNGTNWIANSANGSSGGEVGVASSGCNYTISYYVSGPAGSASDSVQVNVNTATNGSCGSSNGGSYSSPPASGLCSSGNASGVATNPTTYNWSCGGINGGTTASCSANRIFPVNGSCGSAITIYHGSGPTTNLCSAGSQSSVTANPTTYTWSCNGTDGGTNASCSAPRVTSSISTNPVTTTVGNTSTATWSSVNATACTASGAWSNGISTSGSQQLGPYSTANTYLYTLSCTHSSNPSSSAVTNASVIVSGATPTASISANPTTTTIGNSSTLTWSSTNATTCSASGDWSGTKSTSGSQSTGSFGSLGTYSYTIICSNGASQSTPQTATVTVALPLPTINISVDDPIVGIGDSVTVTWSTTDADSCIATGNGPGWTGTESVGGPHSQLVGPFVSAGSFVFGLSCTGPGGTTNSSPSGSTVGVYDPPEVAYYGFGAEGGPTTINIASGDSVSFSWSVSGPGVSCTASGGDANWPGGRPTTGSYTSGPITSDTTFTLTCTGDGGTVTLTFRAIVPAVCGNNICEVNKGELPSTCNLDCSQSFREI